MMHKAEDRKWLRINADGLILKAFDEIRAVQTTSKTLSLRC